jgi:hypothetical protein
VPGGSEEAKSPKGGLSALANGACPSVKHPPLIKNPFVLVIVKSKFNLVVKKSFNPKSLLDPFNTALSITYLII